MNLETKTYSSIKSTSDWFKSNESPAAVLFAVSSGDLLRVCWKRKLKICSQTYKGHSMSDAEEIEIIDEGAPLLPLRKN